jgi:thiol:disulfide interchange protein
MSLGTLGLAFLAGALSVLSPCVLPLLPIVLGSAASEHRLAPAALAAGLALSFVVRCRRSSSSPSARCFWCRGLAPKPPPQADR